MYAIMTDENMFELWARSRLVYSQYDNIAASDAFNDYNLTCHRNGVRPVTMTKFGAMMTAWQEDSDGLVGVAITKGASGKNIFYCGVRFAND
jgi:hypothetical protein